MKKAMLMLMSCSMVWAALGFLSDAKGTPSDGTTKKIDWYGTLESGLQEAKRTNKPILLLAAAPQCLGVPGIW